MLNVLCVILITLLLSYLTLCLGTLVPKRLAMKNPEAIARRSLLLLEVSAVIFRPFVMLLNAPRTASSAFAALTPTPPRTK